MTINTERLEQLFQDFVLFLRQNGEEFKGFASSAFVDREENYKYGVHIRAKEALEQRLWNRFTPGTGDIHQRVTKALQAKRNNNLVDWRKIDDFDKLEPNAELESNLLAFFKNKSRDAEIFASLIDVKLSYQLVAYLFFIKDKERYLPITQERFDEIFSIIGLPEFKTSRNATWENYSTFTDIIRQVKTFLKGKDKNVTLLDAHSFLYILGSQMREAGYYTDKHDDEHFSQISDAQPGESDLSSSSVEGAALEPVNTDFSLPEELLETEELLEGTKKSIVVNAYERNPKAQRFA